MFHTLTFSEKIHQTLLRRRIQSIVVVCIALLVCALVLFGGSVVHSVLRASASESLPSKHLDERLSARLGHPGVDLTIAMDERKALLLKKMHIRFVDENSVVRSERDIALADVPSWIVFEPDDARVMHAVLSADRIAAAINTWTDIGLSSAKPCTVLSVWSDDQKVLRAQTSCIAKDGLTIDADATAKILINGFRNEATSLDLAVQTVEPTIVDPALESEGTMHLLATGQSTFKGSGDGRKSNVRKGLNERLNNVIIPAGDIFSFNATLGTVSVNKGWKMALTIFEGNNLRPAPGGGICQVSTTLYRAALRAGFPILDHKNHSLFVSYYTSHGVGQDVTIFPGQQDFKFQNNTGHRLLVQAYNDGDDAYVRIYGTPDDRRVTVSGPFFASTTPSDLKASGHVIRSNEVVWRRSVEGVSGVSDEIFTSRYKAIPKSLPKTYVSNVEVTMVGSSTAMHAAAGDVVAVQQ